MVLQSLNSRQLSKKRSLPSKRAIASQSRRRLAQEMTHKSRYSYDIKQRHSKQPRAPYRFQFIAPPVLDVQMKEADIPKTTVVLPRHLPRPDFREINRDNLTAIDPELADTPIEYIQDGLEAMGPDMYKVLTGVKPESLKNALPKELSIIVNDLTSDMPSHMLAVYASQSKPNPRSPRSKVTLFPSHNIILAAHCANLPHLPSASHPTPKTPGQSLTVPVVPLCIPNPELFTPLSVYLYTKRTDLLLTALLPTLPQTPLDVLTSPDETSEEGQKARETMMECARRMSATFTPHALLHYSMRVNAFWRNVCALGIFESKIWAIMDYAWESLLIAMAMATGNVDQVVEEPSS